MSDPAPPSELVERVARAIGDALGLPFDTLYVDKREYINDRGSRHDVNAPHKADMLEAAQAAIAALPAAGAAMALRDALENLTNFAWTALTADCEEARVHLNSLVAAASAALASAPARDATPAAPSGEYAGVPAIELGKIAAIIEHDLKQPMLAAKLREQAGTEYARAIEDAAAWLEALKFDCKEQRYADMMADFTKTAVAAIRALSPTPQDDARLALASALDRALTCWRDPEMRASAHFDAAMDDLVRLSPPNERSG